MATTLYKSHLSTTDIERTELASWSECQAKGKIGKASLLFNKSYRDRCYYPSAIQVALKVDLTAISIATITGYVEGRFLRVNWSIKHMLALGCIEIPVSYAR